jgi:hypothetical protein
MEKLICYCFGYTESDIKNDYLENGHSTILEKIAAEKKQGTCQCAEKNPGAPDVSEMSASWWRH